MTRKLGSDIIILTRKLGNDLGGFNMDKNEILEKSRAENKNRDLYAQEVSKTANSAAVLVMLIIAAVFFLVQLYVGGGPNFGIWAIIFGSDMALHWVRFIKLHSKVELVMAIFYTVIVAVFSGYHIYSLIS